MRTLALLLVLGCASIAQAQSPKSYTPSTPPHPGEETIVNARVVSVDRAPGRLTVRGVDVKADGGSNETYTVSTSAANRLSDLKPGMEVLLTLSGTTVVDVKVSVASGGPGGNVIQGTATGNAAGTTTRGRARGRNARGGSATPAAGAGATTDTNTDTSTGGATVDTGAAGVVPVITGAPGMMGQTIIDPATGQPVVVGAGGQTVVDPGTGQTVVFNPATGQPVLNSATGQPVFVNPATGQAGVTGTSPNAGTPGMVGMAP